MERRESRPAMTIRAGPAGINRIARRSIPDSLRARARAWRWRAESLIRKMTGKSIPWKSAWHAIGDSHAKYIFSGARGFQVHYLGPVTMHRVARDGRNFLRLQDFNVHDRDILIWCLGEIDVRCHIVKQAPLQTAAINVIAGKLAGSFLESVAEIQRDARQLGTIVLAVIPPTDNVYDREYPMVGSLKERIEARNALNDALREGCAARGFHFLDPYASFMDPAGALKEGMSDGNVHCGSAFASLIVDQVRQSALALRNTV
ncbi:MAG: SGNH/GDSL hydrolase family protein [Anaerolineales bacterium]